MPFPEGLPTTLVTYTTANPAGGGPATGMLEFAPSVPAVAVPGFGIVFTGRGSFGFDTQGRLIDAEGNIGVRLLPNDVEGANPQGWVWMVTDTTGPAPRFYYIKLSTRQKEVDLSKVQQIDPSRASYVLVPGPAGPPGATGERGPAGANGQDGSPGAQGPARPGIIATAGQPDDTAGIDGDWAIDAGARRLYGPKTSGVWESWSHVPPPTGLGWQRNGFAALAGEDLYLTHVADGYGAGTCWRTALEPADGLDVTFEVEMSGGTGADGVCFALASGDTPAAYLGGGGGDLGLVGCDAVALALDTGGGSRARLVTTSVGGPMVTVATFGGVLDLRGAPVQVRVRYAGDVFAAWADGVLLVSAAGVAALGELVRPGWTGANGGLVDDHVVRRVEFAPRGGIEL